MSSIPSPVSRRRKEKTDRPLLAGKLAALGTMHGKERVIRPVFETHLRLKVAVPASFDTDRFGTFTREIARKDSQFETARQKALAAIVAVSGSNVGVASEGSFGPHPAMPYAAGGVEMVVLIAPDLGLELAGTDVTFETNFAHTVARTTAEAWKFAERIGFPFAGIVVLGLDGPVPSPAFGLHKGITSAAILEKAVGAVMEKCGAAHLETDMRAHFNPLRMRSIERATNDLVQRFLSRCPRCAWPGFGIVEIERGLPCSSCREPTKRVRAQIFGCEKCGTREERPVTRENSFASPAECDGCNP